MNPPPDYRQPSRRQILAGLGAGLALPLLPHALRKARAADLEELVLYGPPAGPSILLAQILQNPLLTGQVARPSFKIWRTPDEMRAGLTSGAMQAVVLPTQVAANLYNRGLPLRLLNVLTEGLLYIISADASIDGLPALRDRTVAVPFRNDMPDLVLKHLLARLGMEPGRDLVLQSTGSPVEAMQLLMMGRVDAALVSEPAGTAAGIQGKLLGKKIHRVIDIQAAWGEITGQAPILPQAGLAVTTRLQEDHPDVVEALHQALEQASSEARDNPQAAAAAAAEYLDFPAPVLAASIPVSKLVATRAAAARPSIEAMLATLAAADPAIIGGQLPDDGFYL